MFLKDRPASNPHIISHVYHDTFHVANHFWFCPLTNEYQVLQVTMSLYKDMIADSLARVVTSFNIFKLGTGLWRGIEVDRSDLPFDYHKCQFHRFSVCLHIWSHILDAWNARSYSGFRP